MYVRETVFFNDDTCVLTPAAAAFIYQYCQYISIVFFTYILFAPFLTNICTYFSFQTHQKGAY